MRNAPKERQLTEYGQEAIDYIANSKQLQKFIIRKGTASSVTASTYKSRLNRFGLYIFKTYPGKSLDQVLLDCKDGSDPYDLLADYAVFLLKDHKPNQLRQKVKVAKKLLKFCGVKIDNEDFYDNVSLPRKEFPDFVGVEKSQIVELLNNTKNQRLKSAIIMMCATGCRAKEACSVTVANVDFAANTITFPARYTKMRKERTRPMTLELAKQLKIWLAIKYRPHTIVHRSGKREDVAPVANPDDLVLAFWHQDITPSVAGIYSSIHDEYAAMTNMLGMKKKDKRRIITFHSFRRFVKSTISDLGFGDYSEWFIGHAGSTYYRKTEKERLEIFRKIEPYLTFLDTAALEARQQDLVTRMTTMEADLKEQKSIVAALEKAKDLKASRLAENP